MRARLLVGMALVVGSLGVGDALAGQCAVTPDGRALSLPDGWVLLQHPLFTSGSQFRHTGLGSVIWVEQLQGGSDCSRSSARDGAFSGPRPHLFTHWAYQAFFFDNERPTQVIEACLQSSGLGAFAVRGDLRGPEPSAPELAQMTTSIAEAYTQDLTCDNGVAVARTYQPTPVTPAGGRGLSFSYTDFALLAGLSHTVDAPPETGQAVTLTARILALGMAKVFAIELEGGGGRNLDGGWAYGVGMAVGFGGGGKRRLLAVLGGMTAAGISGDRAPARLGVGPRLVAGMRLRPKMVLSAVASLAWSGRIEDQPPPAASEFVDTQWDAGLSVRLTRGPLRFALEGTQVGDAFRITAMFGVGASPKN